MSLRLVCLARDLQRQERWVVLPDTSERRGQQRDMAALYSDKAVPAR